MRTVHRSLIFKKTIFQEIFHLRNNVLRYTSEDLQKVKGIERMKFFFLLGAVNAFLAVALGAFGAHGLEGKIPDKYLETWKTAVQYQMFHTLGLFTVAFLADKLPNVGQVALAGWVMLVGIILFSGSLYVLSLTQIRVLGAITPFGGLAFLIAWLVLGYVVVKFL